MSCISHTDSGGVSVLGEVGMLCGEVCVNAVINLCV